MQQTSTVTSMESRRYTSTRETTSHGGSSGGARDRSGGSVGYGERDRDERDRSSGSGGYGERDRGERDRSGGSGGYGERDRGERDRSGGSGGYGDKDKDRYRDRDDMETILQEKDKELEGRGGSESRYESRYSRSEERGEGGGVSGKDYSARSSSGVRGGGGSATRYDKEVTTTSTSGYRPMMTSRNLVIQRSSGGYPSYGGGSRVSRTIERSYGSSSYGGGGMGGLPAGSYAHVTNTEMSSMRNSREKEKRDMQDLNERFASYIEKVRFLEAQNKKLADELEKLKSNWGKETSQVKIMFETELSEARRLLDDGERDRAKLEVRNATLEDQVSDLRDKLVIVVGRFIVNVDVFESFVVWLIVVDVVFAGIVFVLLFIFILYTCCCYR